MRDDLVLEMSRSPPYSSTRSWRSLGLGSPSIRVEGLSSSGIVKKKKEHFKFHLPDLWLSDKKSKGS
jgi:hypothetical protein